MLYSIGMLKPDCLHRGLVDRVMAVIESHGFTVLSCKVVNLTQEQINTMYGCCRHEDYYQEFLLFLRSGSCMVFVVKFLDTITRLNNLVGPSDPREGKAGQIRHDFGESILRNVIHSTKNEERFWEELGVLFNKREIKNMKIEIHSHC